jgi:sulfoxide reductase heme-binding subunit YedZ
LRHKARAVSLWLMDKRYAPIVIAVVLSIMAIMVAALLGSDTTQQLRLAARYTARASFALFIVTYSASALLRLWPSNPTKALVRHRRQWGLGFALVHTVHLAALSWFNIAIANMPGLQTLLGGGLAYGLMYVMAFTSNDASVKALGVWWKRIHRVGIHWLWFIFAFSYFGRLFDPAMAAQGYALFPICMAAIGLRLAAWAKTRRRVTATSAKVSAEA